MPYFGQVHIRHQVMYGCLCTYLLQSYILGYIQYWCCCRYIEYMAIMLLVLMKNMFLTKFQATTLNVAFNSRTQALLAIMMSNNFVELKGSVFKKFAKANLFQMSCRYFFAELSDFLICTFHATQFISLK